MMHARWSQKPLKAAGAAAAWRLAVLLVLAAFALPAAGPVIIDGGGPAPETLTDRMRVVFDAFDERATLGETPSSVTIAWDDVGYTLAVADYLAYREGERSFLQTAGRVRIELSSPWSPRVLWRRYQWPIVGAGAVLLLIVLWLTFSRGRRRGSRENQASVAPQPTPAALPTPAQPPVLCLFPLAGPPHALHAECTSIGSQEGNLLRIAGRGVAPQHARIWRTREGAWFLEDLGSPYGTVMNGQRITRQWLQPGVSIAIGEWQARVDWTHPNAGPLPGAGPPQGQPMQYVRR